VCVSLLCRHRSHVILHHPVMTHSDQRGRFDGEVVVTFLPDGRNVKLIQPFAYVDSRDEWWDVPDGAIVDGASIPQALWTFMGGPFEGKYRDASIVHDWYCDLRSRPWRDVHRVFYEAMVTSGVPLPRARLMYAGVYWGGPRWSERVSSNINELVHWYRERNPEAAAKWDASPAGRERRVYLRPIPENYHDPRNYAVERTTTTTVSRYKFGKAELELLERAVFNDDLGPNELAAVVEDHLQSRDAADVATYVRKEEIWFDEHTNCYQIRTKS
jgi:hypothetical protein